MHGGADVRRGAARMRTTRTRPRTATALGLCEILPVGGRSPSKAALGDPRWLRSEGPQGPGHPEHGCRGATGVEHMGSPFRGSRARQHGRVGPWSTSCQRSFKISPLAVIENFPTPG